MKHKDTQLHMKEAALTPKEKAALRSVLRNRIQTAPLQASVFDYLRFLRSLRVATVGFASIVFVGVGVSYAAESALPGDVLYPVKVEVTERMRTWASVSQEAQAEWFVVRTTRRLEELEQLMVAGDLNKKISDEIFSRLEDNTDEANRTITHLKTARIDVAADTSSRLESSLRVHERVLVQVAEERADMGSQIRVILDTVREKARGVAEVRDEIEGTLTEGNETTAIVGQEVVARKQKEAEDALQQIRVFLDTRRTDLDTEGEAQAERRLTAAAQEILNGEERVKNGELGAAFAAFQRGTRIAEEARVLLDARENLRVDIDLNNVETKTHTESGDYHATDTEGEILLEVDSLERIEKNE